MITFECKGLAGPTEEPLVGIAMGDRDPEEAGEWDCELRKEDKSANIIHN